MNSLSPRLYDFVKRNPALRNALAPFWQASGRALAWSKSLGTRPVPAPTRVASVAGWARENGARFFEVCPPEHKSKTLPLTIEPRIHWKFRLEACISTPSTFVLEVPNGRVWGHGQAVMTEDGQLLDALSKEMRDDIEAYAEPKDHSILRKRHLPPPTRIAGQVAVLSAPAGGGYYHWMADLLPRLWMLEQAGYALDAIDHFIVNAQITRYQRETLVHLGIPRQKLIESQWQPHVQADSLLCPSLPGDYGQTPRWAFDFLRSAFSEFLSDAQEPGLRLYVSRSGAAHRRVTNEREVVGALKAHGFQSVGLETLPFAEQLRLLSSAEFVCGPHGAGLTNLLFCQPGTKVLELLSPVDVSTVYWNIASEMDLVYAYQIAEGARPAHGKDPHLGEKDLRVDLTSLEAVLELAARASVAS